MSAFALTSLTSALVLAGPAFAQSRLAQISGTVPQGYLGSSVVGLGDVDGDGLPDFAVGAPHQVLVTAPPGTVFVCKGATAAPIHTLNGAYAGDNFGYAMAAAGDVDGDGVSELLVGAPDFPPGSGHLVGTPGCVERFSGASGALGLHVNGDAPDDMFGASVAGLDDLNGDGVEDFAVGSPGHDGAVVNGGMVRLISGASGATLWSSYGSQTSSGFGGRLSNVGDVNGDSHDDLICGATSWDGAFVDAGAAFLLSGATGATLRSWFGVQQSNDFGSAVAGVGDIDGDGVRDVAIGAYDAPYPTSNGTLYVYSVASGALIYQRVGANAGQFGFAVAPIGDLDGDGVNELAVGENTFNVNGVGAHSGAVSVLAGADGTLLGRAFGGTLAELFGWSVAGLGDVDGDGRLDFVAGAIDFKGYARVLTVGSPMPPSTFCGAKVNSQNCLPEISATGSTSLSGPDNFTVLAKKVINQKPGLFIWSPNMKIQTFQNGLLCVGSPTTRTSPVHSGGGTSGPDCSGVLSYHFTHAYMLGHGLAPGSSFCVQGWHRDTALPFNSIGLTDGLFVMLSP